MSDPVADKSGFLCMYMSGHPDTLVAYAKWFGKVKEQVSGAKMTGITSKNITLACTFKDGSTKDVVVPIEPPLAGYDDVKPRLLEMKALAQEGLGMIKAPRIEKFTFPSVGTPGSGLLVTSVILLYFAPAFTSSGFLPTAFLVPLNFVHQLIGEKVAAIFFWTVASLHVLESAYTFSLCWKYSTGFLVGLQYVASTFYFGYPIWTALRKEVQTARIDSVMKVE